jgi:hypothetical protein
MKKIRLKEERRFIAAERNRWLTKEERDAGRCPIEAVQTIAAGTEVNYEVSSFGGFDIHTAWLMIDGVRFEASVMLPSKGAKS